MPYLSLYRKYRPRRFTEIIGQRHVTQTLVNAVKADRIAHAYLFCGPRGTGKTSTARALAMALNCAQGPTPEPCGECTSCTRIPLGRALDVIEIDAASNRGIDEIRALRDRVGVAPAESRSKVYIIDEVHMLTGEAFNAFLKTLEEPPAYVIFVLATTEPHRVLPTILSRCQRFDFHRVGLRDIEENIERIAENEGIRLDGKAMTMLAYAADGSVRDSLTLLDQALAYAEGEVTPEVVTEILGGIDFDLLAEFADVFIRKDVPAALALVERVVAEGKNVHQLVVGLIEHYRNLLVLRIDRRGANALALPEEALGRASDQAQALSPEEITRTLSLLAETDRELRASSQPRLLLELCAVRVCRAGEAARAESPRAAPPAKRPRKAASPGRPAPPEQKQTKPAPQSVGEPVGPGDLAGVQQRWGEVIAELSKAGKKSVSAFVRDSTPVALEGDLLTVAFKHQFHHDQMMRDEGRRRVVAEAVSRVFGLQVGIRCTLAGPAPAAAEDEGGDAEQEGKLQDVMSMFPGSELEE